MDWLETSPKYGDIIRTKYKFYHHYGIYLNENEVVQFGLPQDVGKPADEIKVIKTNIYTFLQGGEIEVGSPNKEEKGLLRKPEEIASIATSKIGEGGYDILHNNCEHFVNFCAFGAKKSSFVDNIRSHLRSKLGK